jgi:hypothetical protein
LDYDGQASDGEVEDYPLVIGRLTGDYNADGAVDAADYVFWRNTKDNAVTPFAGADGSGNGVVDDADYSVWRAHFGQSLASASAGSAVPVSAATSRNTLAAFAGPASSSQSQDNSLDRATSQIVVPFVVAQPPTLTKRESPVTGTASDHALLAWLAVQRAHSRGHAGLINSDPSILSDRIDRGGADEGLEIEQSDRAFESIGAASTLQDAFRSGGHLWGFPK